MNAKHCAPSLVLALATLVSAPSSAHELLVGRSAGNQILLILEGEIPYELGESTFPGFDGYAEADPGWVATDEDLPAQGLFMLPPTCDIEFVLLDGTPHIQVWNDTGTAPMQIGETFHIGQPLFHSHPIWQSPDGVPNEIYSLTIRLRDSNGVLTQSVEHVIPFEVIPTISPGDIDGDGDVDLADLAAMLSSFGQCFGDPTFLGNADLDDDGCVNLADLAVLLASFGS